MCELAFGLPQLGFEGGSLVVRGLAFMEVFGEGTIFAQSSVVRAEILR